ncbi:MAG: NAD-dependent epimerase/dehydratase family protein [Gammaproteobacteria bacterium]|nr:MAG: NAD-dependent epimerase/dehydratase family protein [Gammaproteobacteria bacterium]
MTRVLLTGAGGFLGRHVSEALIARGFEVHAVSRRDRTANRLTWHALDLLDSASLERLVAALRPTHLLHLAWYTEPSEYWQSRQNLSWLNASVGLLESFARHGGERAVLAGTCAEYDWTYGYCVEDTTPCKAGSLYAASKLALHDVAGAFARTADLGVAWARIFFPFGPYERPGRLVPSVMRALLAGERAACSDGEQIRDFVYVRDAASALVALLDHEFCGDVNIASGRPVVLKDVVNLIADKLNARDRVDFGRRPRQGCEPPLLLADVSRLKNVIGWTPSYDMETAVDETIAWWRERAG